MMKHLIRLVIVGLLLLALLPVAAQQETSPGAKPVIIDTDMAVDDWMAILYLLQRTDVNVLTITIAGTGEAHCNPGVQNAMNLAALAGNPAIPVACGRETPLAGSNTFPQEWRDWVDAMAGITLAANPNPPVEQDAVGLLRGIINGSDQNITLVTLGPLTNVAELVQADPSVVERLDMIYVMGGAFDAAGNVRPFVENDFAEWNIYVDPLAAAQVLESGAPVTFVALDATNHAPVTMAFYDRLAGDRATPEAEFVYRALTRQIGFIQSGGYYFWDPLAAVTATDESVVSIQGRPARVITEAGAEFGRTALDSSGDAVRVAVDADGSRFEQIFLNVLNGRDPSAALPEAALQPEPVAPVTTPIESAADIVGTWRWQTSLFHFQFRPDGTFRANQTLGGLNSDSPEDVGTYQVEAGTVTLTSGETSRFCNPGDVGIYHIYLTATGQLAFVLESDECSMREAPPSVPQLFDLVSADGEAIVFPTGTFMSELYSMSLNADGTYVFGTADGQTGITSGTYGVKGNTFQWITDRYCGTSATYTWAFSDDALTMTPVGEDPCADRQAALSTAYIRLPE